MYNEVGYLMSYTIHPNTKEKIITTRQYPCCAQYTHTIRTLRYLKNRLRIKKKYIVATNANMLGNFFPDSVQYPKSFKTLEGRAVLRWSSEEIEQGAFHASANNEIVRFEKGSVYQVLSERNGFLYVIMYSPPIIEDNELVNPNNLQQTKLLGWLEKIN